MDVPVDGRRIVVSVRVRRLVCPVLDCPRQTFREQVSGAVERYQRRTNRLTNQLNSVVKELAGRAGARLCRVLACAISRSTALRMLMRQMVTPLRVPRVLASVTFLTSTDLRMGDMIDPRQLATAIWPLDEIAVGHERLTTFATTCADRLARGSDLPGVERLTLAVELAAEFSRAMTPDPLRLPELLPAPGPAIVPAGSFPPHRCTLLARWVEECGRCPSASGCDRLFAVCGFGVPVGTASRSPGQNALARDSPGVRMAW